MSDVPPEVIPKPDALLALHGVTIEMFATLRRWFDVPGTVALDLREVDAAVAELGDPQMIAALAMRKLQALHLLATPGVRTTTDVVVAIVNDLDRALVQAPAMRLKRQAAATDWDQAFAELDDGTGEEIAIGASGSGAAPELDAARSDPEADRFRELHGRLHAAVFAVVEVSDGEIRYLV
ncbi:hypothetical protein BH24ACT3_BH24ACT3_07390 [soil metagenome]